MALSEVVSQKELLDPKGPAIAEANIALTELAENAQTSFPATYFSWPQTGEVNHQEMCAAAYGERRRLARASETAAAIALGGSRGSDRLVHS